MEKLIDKIDFVLVDRERVNPDQLTGDTLLDIAKSAVKKVKEITLDDNWDAVTVFRKSKEKIEFEKTYDPENSYDNYRYNIMEPIEVASYYNKNWIDKDKEFNEIEV